MYVESRGPHLVHSGADPGGHVLVLGDESRCGGVGDEARLGLLEYAAGDPETEDAAECGLVHSSAGCEVRVADSTVDGDLLCQIEA